jgi:hypothetical protein
MRAEYRIFAAFHKDNDSQNRWSGLEDHLTGTAMRCENSNTMETSRVALAVLLCVAFALDGCRVSSEFSEDIAKNSIEFGKMNLEGEQVVLTDSQIQCGVQSELWDAPTTLSPDHTTSHLTSKARDLKFNDDVIIRDPGTRVAYVQIRGEFPLQADSVTSVKDGEDKNSKLVEARVSLKIDNPCFQNPLPMMGVRHGNFSPDSPVVFHMHFDETIGWRVDKLVH